jgi:pimeloyl-ACP methyl ester carboxylesterase
VSLTENTITVNQLKWFYREASPSTTSTETPVMLLHGLPSQSFSWCEIMPVLADYGYRAIAPDWLGCGFFAQPDKRDFPYTSEALEALR